MSQIPPPGSPGTTGTHHLDGSACDYATQGACHHPDHVNPGQTVPPELQALFERLVEVGAATTAESRRRSATCKTCGEVIEQDEQGAWVDETGGDVCTEADDGSGNAGVHEPKPRPKPVRKHLTNTQHVTLDSDAERIRLQLKAGLDDNGRPLKDADRQALERQLEFHTQELTEDEEARALLGVDDADAEIRRLLGVEES